MARKRKGTPIHGWLAIDKPLGLSSAQVVAKVKWILQAAKVGHGGTLDPLATGVLPIALGEATKTVSYVMDGSKTYAFQIRWGQATATDDREGEVVETSDIRPDRAGIEAALGGFTGEIEQIPPAYSAIKVDGQRAYDLAREGVEVVLETRKVRVFSAVLADVPDADHAVIEVHCGKGTYVRAIARDLAEMLGVCGHVSVLARTRVGQFSESDGMTLEKLQDLVHRGIGLDGMLPVETALDDIPALAVTGEDAFWLSQGRPIVLVPRQVENLKACLVPRTIGGQDASRTVLATRNGKAAALCELRAGRLNPTRVFHLEPES